MVNGSGEGGYRMGTSHLDAMLGHRNANRGWMSVAVWPETVNVGDRYGNNASYDKHATKEQAEAVCRKLEATGLGGEGKVFPVSTRVEPFGG